MFQYSKVQLIIILYMLNIADSLIQEGVNYAIPASWWKKFRHLLSISIQPSHNSQPQIENINNYSIIDTILVDFEEEIVSELEQKSNDIFVHQRFISPMLLPGAKLGEDFHLISRSFWHELKNFYPTHYPVIIFALKEYDTDTTQQIYKINNLICPIARKQVQIIFCTDKKGFLFIGFFPENAYLLDLIRLIIKEMDLIEKDSSKISFLNVNPQNSIPLCKLQPRKVKQLEEGEDFMMVINLLSATSTFEAEMNISTQVINKSFQGSQIGMAKQFFQQLPILRPDHKTISTGASTPLTFSIDQDRRNDCEFQLVQMLREKCQQEIDELRRMAEKALESQKIMVDNICSQECMKEELQIISDQLIQMVGVHRKKVKDKEYY